MRVKWVVFVGFVVSKLVFGQDEVIKFALIQDKEQDTYGQWFQEWLKTNNIGSKYDLIGVTLEENGNIFEKVCEALSQGCTFILDISWSGYETVKEVAAEMHTPYLRLDVSISPFLDLLDKYLDARNSTDVAIIFDNPMHVDQALYYWVDTTRLRMVVTEHLDNDAVKRLQNMRPSPNNYALLTTTNKMERLYKQVASGGLLKLAERWNLVFLDFDYADISAKTLAPNVNLILPDRTICCSLKKQSECKCSSEQDLLKNFIEATLEILLKVLDTVKLPATEIKCNDTVYDEVATEGFYKAFGEAVKDVYSMKYMDQVLRIRAEGSVEIVNAEGEKDLVAKYVDGEQIQILLPDKVKPVKPFYRIGTTFAMPWSYEDIDIATGQKYWTGYCIDFAAELSKRMNFDYEIVIPKIGTFGRKDRYGNWDGIIGDLARGETDIAIAALTMTADREEVVDYVAPYLEQVGISIVMRKPVRKTSLFKFMTVLKLEVWLSIVGALVVTGFMIWLLDKYSPYSARNNSKAYPYPCREFNLKESFWFALTSFTPQGGGEAPKALSGRTLVAAYWLFVVLMLATFTANLAAFLTVERMQTPVQSLEQLARQSRINYTVVESSETHQYFINMKHAEDTLYRMWKELTLNASTDETQYRVWDYPIREQYGQILIAINDSMPVESAKVGFEKVNEYLDADFAFIHDSAEIKYEISRNCNLTEVGEVFAEKPYALAVQQGSHLQDRLSVMILDLQKDRFFEGLVAKYWNHSNKGDCALSDDNEGITLESLGGVFIATLFGLALAMITLAGEVFYYKRKKRIEDAKPIVKKKQIIDNLQLAKTLKPGAQGTITIGDTFKPVIDTERLRVSHIALYPRSRNRLPNVD